MIPIDLALVTGEPNWTDAFVRVHQVPALSAILAWLRGTLVDIDVAVFARITRGATAVVIVDQVDAQRSVLALAHAVIDVLRAVLPCETAPAATPEDK